MQHARADPRKHDELADAVDISKCKAAIVMADSLWAGRDHGKESEMAGLGLSQVLRIFVRVLL